MYGVVLPHGLLFVQVLMFSRILVNQDGGKFSSSANILIVPILSIYVVGYHDLCCKR